MSSSPEPMDLCDTEQTLEQILHNGRNVAEILGDVIVSLEDHVAQDMSKSLLGLQNALSRAQCDLAHRLNAFEDPPIPVDLPKPMSVPFHGTVAITAKALKEAGMPPMRLAQHSGSSGPLSFTQTAIPNASVFTPDGHVNTHTTETPASHHVRLPLNTPIKNKAKQTTHSKKQKSAQTATKQKRTKRAAVAATTVQPSRFSIRLARRKKHALKTGTGFDADEEDNITVGHEGDAALARTRVRGQDRGAPRGLKRSAGGAVAVVSGRVERKRSIAGPAGARAKKVGRGVGGRKGSKK